MLITFLFQGFFSLVVDLEKNMCWKFLIVAVFLFFCFVVDCGEKNNNNDFLCPQKIKVETDKKQGICLKN
jgi:hypothetical protein